MTTGNQLEQFYPDGFREGGYEYANGYDIAQNGEAPEREDYKQTILTGCRLIAPQVNRNIGRPDAVVSFRKPCSRRSLQ